MIKLKKYIDKNDENNIVNVLESDLKMLSKFIKTYKKIYIPIIGVSSAGKSTILNCLIGYKLFPEAIDECTTRGIILQYNKEIELYRTNVETVDDYYVFSQLGSTIALGINKVKSKLVSFNEQ